MMMRFFFKNDYFTEFTTKDRNARSRLELNSIKIVLTFDRTPSQQTCCEKMYANKLIQTVVCTYVCIFYVLIIYFIFTTNFVSGYDCNIACASFKIPLTCWHIFFPGTV
uniref:Uncharacterized protein n=1 Tax=Sipha flava TaxID=143950 RepID=A0A2S2R811_9HEMI